MCCVSQLLAIQAECRSGYQPVDSDCDVVAHEEMRTEPELVVTWVRPILPAQSVLSEVFVAVPMRFNLE